MWHQFSLHALTYCRLCKDAVYRTRWTYRCRSSFALCLRGTPPLTRIKPITSIYIIRSYHGESTGSHPNSEVKHHWACSVLRWGTTWESQVSNVFASFATSRLEPHSARRASDSISESISIIKHTFSAFWLRSSVVSVLISLISDTMVIDHPVD